MTKQDFIKTVSAIKKMYVIYAKTTRMPMVFCHEETMDDYIYVYLEEEAAGDRVRALNEKKCPAFAVNCKEQEVLKFWGELRLTGVNAVCFVLPKEKGGGEILVQLTDFLHFPDVKAIPEKQRPIENSTLLLSMLYFMQELRKPVEQSEKQNLAELEEETSANLAKARFLIPVKEVQDGAQDGKRAILLLKNEKQEAFFPLFTDGIELRKFTKGQDCQVTVGTFAMLADMLEKGGAATGIVVNPSTVNLVLTKPGIASVKKRFIG